jgi:alpha 1,3-glucosidase
MHGSIPFLIAHSLSSSLGLLWLNPSETWVDVSHLSHDETTIRFLSESGFIDFFLFPGNPESISNSFTKLTGRPQLPPIFALGFYQSRWGYLTQKEAVQVSKRLDDIKVPHDVLWLDIDHTDGNKYFTFQPRNFRDPRKLLKFFDDSKRKLTAIIDPHIKADSSYPIYVEARERDLFIKNSNGQQYLAHCWPDLSSWPDFLNPETRRWWANLFHFSKWKESGSNLYVWNDMNEIAVFDSADGTAPKDLIHFGGYEEREVHNLYGHLMVSASFGGLVKRSANQNNRPFVLTRSYFIGTSKYAFTWTGDNTADWLHLENSIPLILSNGIAGMVYIGEDVGGFFDDPSPELSTRWYQVAAWCYPFFRCRCHYENTFREISILRGKFRKRAVEAVQERYKMLPYWYLLSRISNLTGQPIVRPMWWEFNSQRMIDRDDIAMLGKWILVVPFLEKGNSDIELELPKNTRWYDFRTLVEIIKSKTVAKFNRGRVAVYIRGGGIVPIKTKNRKSSGFKFDDPYTLIIALDENQQATGELYEDDENSFDFLSGSYIHKQYKFDGKTLQSQSIRGNPKSHFVLNYDIAIKKIRITGLKSFPDQIINSNGEYMQFSVSHAILVISRAQLLAKDNWVLQFK